MSITRSNGYWGITTIALYDYLNLFNGNLWILLCLGCSLGVRSSRWNQIVARLRSREDWRGGLRSSQRLIRDNLLRKYLGLRWCHTRLLLYHEHGRWLCHLVIVWPCRFTSFALRWTFVIISVVGIACRDPMRASTCSASRPLLLSFSCFRTSLDVCLRLLLLALSIIWLRS